KTYSLIIRGSRPGVNYCSCPDFAVNNLGTCKHLEFALSRLEKRRGGKRLLAVGYQPDYSEIYLHHGLKQEIRFNPGRDLPRPMQVWADRLFNDRGVLQEEHLIHFPRLFQDRPKTDGHEVRCHDEVLAWVGEHQEARERLKIIEDHLREGIRGLIFKNLLKTDLYPYQREGALFALKAGRSLLGDDMGLGKTVQALAAAELLARFFHLGKVLIVSPTSLKYQWKTEIEKFTGRTVAVIEGLNATRRELFRRDTFFKVINYELIFRDLEAITAWKPDLVILDEAQRIKNWKTRTAKSVKQLESPFALVLTGTPLENRIEELHSIMEFVDCRRLGPLYRFVHQHQVLDRDGKVIGYQNLQGIRETLKPVLLRRKKDEVLRQLPARIDQNIFVPLTPEQRTLHDEFYEIVAKIVAKWRRYKFLTEADQRRLMIALEGMRRSADNTYLVDKKTIHGPKIQELEELLQENIQNGKEKAVIFSQWLRMTELVEEVLKRNGIGYVHLNGSLPSRQRRDLLTRFKDDEQIRVFLSTDAGGVGLNLQSGALVINMDIPWNPAKLEQRIGRVHRLGQRRTVRVVNFVSSGSIEARILELLKFKKSVFAGALDQDGEDVVMVGESQMKRFMKTVEEITEKVEKADPLLESQLQREAEQDTRQAELAEKLETVGEHDRIGGVPAAVPTPGLEGLNALLTRGAEFLMNLSRTLTTPAGSSSIGTASAVMPALLEKEEGTGRPMLKIPLPDPKVIQTVLASLGTLLGGLTKGREQ
ncbi:MAG: DEAD/DEAH box helicase, partial [Desulfobacterota bacterium]|nr:DEAD/DEAH box helicase [Thermodesulfobacteriota bacterium]